MPGADERSTEKRVKGESFSCQEVVVACVGGQDCVCVFELGKEKKQICLRMLPV